MSNPNIAQDSPKTWKPGQSGNPAGRPPAPWTMAGLYREALEEENETGTSKKVAIARKLAELAENGDVVAIKELANRLDGLPKQSIEHSGEIKGNAIVYAEFKHEADSE